MSPSLRPAVRAPGVRHPIPPGALLLAAVTMVEDKRNDRHRDAFRAQLHFLDGTDHCLATATSNSSTAAGSSKQATSRTKYLSIPSAGMLMMAPR